MIYQITGYKNKTALKTVDELINKELVNYPKRWCSALVEYLKETIKFRECWEHIWSTDKFRFGFNASDLATKYTLPVIKSSKAHILWDLGAGTGRDSLFFTKFCNEVACVEISKAAADAIREQAKERKIKNIAIINEDVWSALKKQNSIKKGFVDVVHAHSFLHYTKSLMTNIMFLEIYDLLKKGGRLVFAVKGKGDHLFGKGKRIAKDMWVYFDGQRRKFYNEISIRKLLGKLGFEIELLTTEKEYFDDKISEFVVCVAKKG